MAPIPDTGNALSLANELLSKWLLQIRRRRDSAYNSAYI
jgi:hypothetical protein